MAPPETKNPGTEQSVPEKGAAVGSDTRASHDDDDEGEVVYRRLGTNESDGGSTPRSPEEAVARTRTREIAPAITPLIIGFTLLLALVSLLGYLSVQRMDEVSFRVVDLEQQHAAKLGLLLNLRLAVTKLNNEVRARQDSEARREFKPPFDFRSSLAREEINQLSQQLDRPPLSEGPSWRRFRDDLRSYAEVTEDLRRYSLEGFEKFRAVDEQLDGLLTASTVEQSEIFRQSEAIEQEATRSIRRWSTVALMFGLLVAVGTIWEVQRRFRQMRGSMFEARRERVFANQLLEGMVSAVAATDDNNRIRSANAAFFKIFPRASIGASVFEKFGSDDAMKMIEAATSVRADEATYRGRWVCRLCDDHKEKTFDVYSSPLAIDGDRGQIITLVDATEASESERGLRRSESLAAVGQATAQVAHEIRNPLGSIRLGVTMLRESVSTPDALNTIELVERGIKHLNKLVVDVTQFSRQKAPERSRVDLHELIDMSLDLVSESVKEKQTPVEKDFSSEPLVGDWDGHQLRQVFVNVISNAVDASREGAPLKISTKEVTLTESGRGESGATRRYARVAISDQGKGIDETSVDRIFEPFFSTKKRGTGLGLAIVKQLVELHEGKISLDSPTGKGTRFIIDLPL
ncbi:MAG: ATP-binding protein [Acidobacteriota bacterium]|nr:ATP-binding protein [Acidobacteriota bacterium]